MEYQETSIGKIPSDWEVLSLGNVASFKNGINFNNDQKGEKGYPTVDVLNMYGNNINVDLEQLYRVDISLNKKEYLLKKGDVLFVRSSLKKEGSGWASLFKGSDEPVTFCGFIIRARINKENITPEFLTYFLRSDTARNKLINSSGKVTISNITQDSLKILKIPVPPIYEQEKIADILSRTDQAIQKSKEIIAKSERIKIGMMQKLLTEGMGHDEFKEVDIWIKKFMIPKEWNLLKFKDISTVRQGLQIAINKRFKEPGKNRHQYITVQYLNDPENFQYYVENPPKSVICTKNDILMTRTGNTGMVITDQEGVFHNNFFLVDFNRKLVNKDFLNHYLSWHFIKKYLKIKAGTTTIPDLNHEDFYSAEFICPPLNEQEKISQILNEIDQKVRIEKVRKNKLQNIKKGLMNDLLTGHKRVQVNN
ncbi:MAG: restriction endonuclease subunit S [Candidatus Pacebacteria bacterium]|nr:restriction endonuclease subunit S [Candidatus Paceibacterota bacterium]